MTVKPQELQCGKCGSWRQPSDLEAVHKVGSPGVAEWRCVNKGFCDWAWEYAVKTRGEAK